MRKQYVLFTEAEDAIVRAGYDEKLTDIKIARRLTESGYPRSHNSVLRRRRTLNLIYNKQTGWEVPKNPLSGDQKFKKAMLAALKAGTETAITGVIKDHRPFALTTIHAEPAHSCFSSPANLCATTA
jgi:hypothetical protein